MSNLGLFIVIIACVIFLSGINNISNIFVQAQDSHLEHHSMGELPIINQDSMMQLDTNGRISFKIKGIDYSTIIAQILVTVNGKTFAQTFDPIAMLDPHDDGNGLIEFEMLFPGDALKPGSLYTSCIKILEDTDNFGTNLACQTGSINDIHSLSGESQQIYLKI
jgi:hypothetical protein